MEHSSLNSSGGAAVSATRVPFVELVSPVHDHGVEIAESLRAGGSLLGRVVEAYRRRRAINRTLRELSRLDDRMLADIGLHRSQIMAVAYSMADHVRTAE